MDHTDKHKYAVAFVQSTSKYTFDYFCLFISTMLVDMNDLWDTFEKSLLMVAKT